MVSDARIASAGDTSEIEVGAGVANSVVVGVDLVGIEACLTVGTAQREAIDGDRILTEFSEHAGIG